MVDSIEDSDVRRVDQNVDPTALGSQEIAEELPDDFSSDAKEAFGKRVSAERQAVREQFDASRRQVESGSGARQLQGPDGQFGPKVADVTDTQVTESGEYQAILKDGSTFTIERLDLQAGADEPRRAEW